jgi:hypothetical protein
VGFFEAEKMLGAENGLKTSHEVELSDRDAMDLSDSEAVDEAVVRNYIIQRLVR